MFYETYFLIISTKSIISFLPKIFQEKQKKSQISSEGFLYPANLSFNFLTALLAVDWDIFKVAENTLKKR